ALVQKLLNVWQLLDQPHLICQQRDQPALRALLGESCQLECIEALLAHPPCLESHLPSPEDTVFYQLSSGSTGTPKCIPISHRGILAHCEAAGQANGYLAEDVWLNWIPLDHVVPILTWWMQALYRQAEWIHMRTERVLAQPLSCLQAIADYGVSHTWCPNFGFKLISDALESAPGPNSVDLSGVKTWMNAGEQVTKHVMMAFVDTTRPLGLAEAALTPAFGMAEACTCITYDREFALDRCEYTPPGQSTGFVNTGKLIPGVEIRIADADNTLLNEDQIGRLQIRGPVITQGYVRHAEANQAAFVGEGWFNTGDLGLIHNRQLYLTGREKEMILVRGANVYCYEIEALLGDLTGLQSAGVFALNDEASGSEGFGVAVVPDSADWDPEPTPALHALLQQVSQTISARIGLAPALVLPLKPTEFPRTTSGKIMRQQLAQAVTSGRYQERIRSIDLAIGQDRCLPDWFFVSQWQPWPVLTAPALDLEAMPVWLILDVPVIGERSEESLELNLKQLTGLIPLSPAAALAALETGSEWPAGVIWLSMNDHGESEHSQRLRQRLELAKALARQAMPPLFWLDWHWHAEDVSVLNSALLGATQALLQTLAQERPETRCLCLQTQGLSLAQAWQVLLDEAASLYTATAGSFQPLTRHIASEQGPIREQMLLSRLKMSPQSLEMPALAPRQTQLLLGGLGGLGFELAQIILDQPAQSLLIVGRRPLESGSVQDQRWQSLMRLAQDRGQQLAYLAHDLLDPDMGPLLAALASAQSQSGYPLGSLIQAVAIPYAEALIAEQDTASALAHWSLQEHVAQLFEHLLRQAKQPLRVIDISSVNGHFGGFGVSAYALAQGATAARGERFRALGASYHCLKQSIWPGLGLSAHKQNLGRHKGFLSLSGIAGRVSLTALLKQLDGDYTLGLNGHASFVQSALGPQTRLSLQADRDAAHALPPSLNSLLGVYLTGQLRPWQVLTASDLHADWDPAWRLELRDARGIISRPGRHGKLHLSNGKSQIQLGLSASYRPNGQLQLAKPLIPFDPPLTSQAQPTYETEAHTERSATLDQLCWLYAQLLNRESVNPDDDFFALGGHSLLAIQLLARIRTAFELELPLRNLFEKPRLRDLAAVIERMLPKAAAKNQTTSAPHTSLPPLIRQRRTAGKLWPLSFAQERIWFMAQLTPECGLYHTLFSLDIRGPLQPERLELSLQGLIHRHEVLRAAFVPQPARPTDAAVLQQILDPQDMPTLRVEVQDLRTSHPETARLQADAAGLDLARRPFDLQQPPLIRAVCLQLADRQFVVQLLIHHLISDAWTMALLFQALSQGYRQADVLAEPTGAKTTLQYLDFVCWQRSLLQGDYLQRQLDFWSAELADLPELLPLPTDHPRPAHESHAGALLNFELPPALSQALSELAQTHDLTLFMLMLAAFQVLLYRYTQQTDILVGVPVANRPLREFETMPGLFVNTLVIRGRLDHNPRFQDFAKALGQRCLAAYAHADLPFEKLVEVINPVRSLSHHPIFQVMFALQSASESQALQEALQFEGLNAQLHRPGEGYAKFDLSLEIQVPAEPLAPLSGRLEYNAELFEPASMQALIAHFEVLLGAIVSNPGQHVAMLELMPPAKAHQILVDWNQTEAIYPENQFIHQLFEKQVDRTPNKAALVYQGQSLSYAELNSQANQLAHWLIE
ncbi:MAG: hypothetical protein CVV27_13915, partial [Candidatus Melainabacteria bacterium HGW-Melainabacteria-1]